MNITNIEGLQTYSISYNPRGSDGKKHYSYAKLLYKGYLIELPIMYYLSLDDAVEGLKNRLIRAIKEFDLTN